MHNCVVDFCEFIMVVISLKIISLFFNSFKYINWFMQAMFMCKHLCSILQRQWRICTTAIGWFLDVTFKDNKVKADSVLV